MIVGEYVEPGRSAREMSKRVAFQQMLSRVHAASDVDCILVYKLSRLARNRIDDALVMADLRQRGVTLVSATESSDDSPVGQLMHGILATVNEYQSRETGADIADKMGQKARNRTIIVDPERAPRAVQHRRYSLDELAAELRTRPTPKRPAKTKSIKKLSCRLRDRYYLGYITCRG